MLLTYMDYPIIIVYLLPAILISLTIHELSHAYTSYRLGDPTAKNMGRLTLNPLKHLDVFGTIMLLVSRFGWAKPVPINPTYYKDYKKGTMIVSLAGPMSNILLATIFSIPLMYFGTKYNIRSLGQTLFSQDYRAIIYNFSSLMVDINIGLAVFNILPIPPLDGSKILSGILPNKQYYKLLQYENQVGMIFILIVFVIPGVLNFVMSPFIRIVETIINLIVTPIVKMIL